MKRPVKKTRTDSLTVHYQFGPFTWGKSEFVSWYVGFVFNTDYHFSIGVNHP